MTTDKLSGLRTVIQEGLRVQRNSADPVSYIDTNNVLSDIQAKQNHVVFARRGCGKSLLLHHSARHLGGDVRVVYLNCEDFKKHSFPNVLIEILDSLFAELEKHLSGWFGRKKRSKELIQEIRQELNKLRSQDDVVDADVRQTCSSQSDVSLGADIGAPAFKASSNLSAASKDEVERKFRVRQDKLKALDNWLPRLKAKVREFFEHSSSVKAAFIQIDDFYHLRRDDQPFIADYVHRLCKDVPLYFKIATLRHASTLYVARDGQPIGIQERHDFQPINIDFTFANFSKAREQNNQILKEYGKQAEYRPNGIDALFKGQGFERLVMAGGGVPRDTLSLFLEALSSVQSNTDKRIGKDDVRIISKSNFERRIEELKQDSGAGEQELLIKGIYVIRTFCIDKKTNVFLVPERTLQQDDEFRSLIYRLLDYRIIHSAATALTHKSREGTFQAFAIDIGCYAHLRKLDGRFNEIDLSSNDAKERFRSMPVIEAAEFRNSFDATPPNPEDLLMEEN